MVEVVQIKTDPDIYEPFNISQAVRVGEMVFVSGQAALNTSGDIVGPNDFDLQAQQTFTNLRAVLEAAGSNLHKVVKVTIYLTDMGNFAKMVDLRARYFSAPYPADTIVEVSAFALPDLQIEIEAVALV